MVRLGTFRALACCALAAAIAGQSDGARIEVEARLITTAGWSWQCDPIRCTLSVTNAGADRLVRPKYTTAAGSLFPFEVERERDGRWEPMDPPQGQREHPARYLTSPAGLRVGRDQTASFEVELWDLEAVSRAGRMRMRFLLETGDRAGKDAKWLDAPTPWLEIEIREHAANAAFLSASDATARRSAYDLMSFALNSTHQATRNRGPFNPGPGGLPRRWGPHVPIAEQILAAAGLSMQLRARAHLVIAYDAIEQAMRAPEDARAAHLRNASAHLGAVELVASPPSGGLAPLPSGGLEPLRCMLAAYVDARLQGQDSRRAHSELCARYPVFATWWRWELRDLLLP